MIFKKICAGLGLSTVVIFANTNAIQLNFSQSYSLINFANLSHPNILEEPYFNNEMRKALMEYKNFNGKLKKESHEIVIANENISYWKNIKEEEVFHDEFVYEKIFIKNSTNQPIYTPKIELNYDVIENELSLNSQKVLTSKSYVNIDYKGEKLKINLDKQLNFNKKWIIVKKAVINPNKIDPNKCMISETLMKKTITHRQKILYIPIDNDAIFKTIIDNHGNIYTLNPVELVNFIKNDRKSLEYYLGKEEFFQYKDFIGKEDSDYLIWAAAIFDEWEINLNNFESFTRWNIDIPDLNHTSGKLNSSL